MKGYYFSKQRWGKEWLCYMAHFLRELNHCFTLPFNLITPFSFTWTPCTSTKMNATVNEGGHKIRKASCIILSRNRPSPLISGTLSVVTLIVSTVSWTLFSQVCMFSGLCIRVQTAISRKAEAILIILMAHVSWHEKCLRGHPIELVKKP